MIEYKFKEENVEDKRKATIIKTGHEVEFTLSDMESNEKYYEKVQKECFSNSQLIQNQIANIEEHHPFVKELDEEKQHHISLYYSLKTEKKKYDDKFLEVSKILDKSYKEKAEIKKVLEIPEEVVVIDPKDLEETKTEKTENE